MHPETLSLTQHWAGIACLAVFATAYAGVVAEEFLGLRKSVPMLVGAALIWVLLGWAGGPLVADALRYYLLEFCELFLFLLAAMTFVNTLEERGLFRELRDRLLAWRLSLRALFWVTGGLAFVISPVADNLTTALLMGAVVVNVGAGRPRFVTVSCVSVVVAANAGGAFSPFGDITTLMVWQAGKVQFHEFFALFVPSLVTWLVPALFMALAVEPGNPAPSSVERQPVLPGAYAVAALFLGTIAASVVLHNHLHLPPVLGMMGGLGLLKVYGYTLGRRLDRLESAVNEPSDVAMTADLDPDGQARPINDARLNVYSILEKAEWDTLMFFYGVILCVGGLGTAGYLALASQHSYGVLGPTASNVLVGLLSAVVDNIPVMVAVLSMNLEMSHGQWLLVTLTAGVGGSLLSVGSAAGVALMGQARGVYTFASHLRWTPVIGLGYAAGIVSHLWLNRGLF
ncbi:MAG: sodium:proton antiporter NhaD [Candidatus Eremiobacterota bacterium]